jgi:hypothetical protein
MPNVQEKKGADPYRGGQLLTQARIASLHWLERIIPGITAAGIDTHAV